MLAVGVLFVVSHWWALTPLCLSLLAFTIASIPSMIQVLQTMNVKEYWVLAIGLHFVPLLPVFTFTIVAVCAGHGFRSDISLFSFSVIFVYLMNVLKHVIDKTSPFIKPTHVKDWFRKLGFWRLVRLYFNFKLEISPKLLKSRQYMFVVHPHGVIPWAPLLTFSTHHPEFHARYPTLVRALIHGVIFFIPGIRELTSWMGCVDVSKDTVNKVLSSGQSCFLCPGGNAEFSISFPKTNYVILNSRKGFVRIAVERGVDLVPCFVFGATDAYQQPQWGWMRKFRRWLIHKTRSDLPIYWGKWFTWWPFKKPMAMVIGDPLKVPKQWKKEDFRDVVDEMHAKYVEALKMLFEEYKDKFPGVRVPPLEIVE